MPLKTKVGLLAVLVLLTGPVRGHSDTFTAIVHMEELLDIERELLSSLDEYIAAEKERLEELQEISDAVSHAHGLFRDQPASTHLHNPVNALQLMNRYANIWTILGDTLQDASQNFKGLAAVLEMVEEDLSADEEFTGAVMGLLRLQETYQLPASVIVSEQLGRIPSVPLTIEDHITIGYEASQSNHWAQSREWMKLALEDIKKSGSDQLEVFLPEVYEHLAHVEYRLGNMKKALYYTNELLNLVPEHENGRDDFALLLQLQMEHPEQFLDAEANTCSIPESDGRVGFEKYEETCREGRILPASEQSKLLCYYSDNDRNPRLVLQPAKVEVVYLDPEVVVFRDLVSEAEMERMKELATPMLQRARIQSVITTGNVSDTRIGKSAWLYPSNDSMGYLSRIDQRIEDVTGLNMLAAEPLQVLNYGIGGHYVPHYDFYRVPHPGTPLPMIFEIWGNRISTLLIYMSDVELGGATVFPSLGLRVTPSKGDALYWWNLKKSGKTDLRTLHAGCPVLVGYKWVCNKWIHERGQEFRRPCSLSPDE